MEDQKEKGKPEAGLGTRADKGRQEQTRAGQGRAGQAQTDIDWDESDLTDTMQSLNP